MKQGRSKKESLANLKESLEAFGVAVREVYKRRGWTSTRQVFNATGVQHTQVSKMLKGFPPGPEALRKWASAIGEPLAKWVALANGLEWDPAAMRDPPTSQPPAPPQVPLPAVPAAILEAIDAAEGREDKLTIAYGYLRTLQAKGLIRFGADKSDTYDVRLHIIRTYEQITGQRLLGPDVV